MDYISALQKLLTNDPLRYRALEIVADLNLPDCWIGAGFVRDALWDHLHSYDVAEPSGDIDVVWCNADAPQEDIDRRIEQQLCIEFPGLRWSVKNQARMHERNGDRPYTSVADAMQHWPETATAVAARLGPSGSIDINAPLGLQDLFELQLRPTSHFMKDKFPIFIERVASKRWIERYPKLSLLGPEPT